MAFVAAILRGFEQVNIYYLKDSRCLGWDYWYQSCVKWTPWQELLNYILTSHNTHSLNCCCFDKRPLLYFYAATYETLVVLEWNVRWNMCACWNQHYSSCPLYRDLHYDTLTSLWQQFVVLMLWKSWCLHWNYDIKPMLDIKIIYLILRYKTHY